jgi:hypothetical protein
VNLLPTAVSAQKAYNCPHCNALIPLGMQCSCPPYKLSHWARVQAPHCQTCTCSEATSASVVSEK